MLSISDRLGHADPAFTLRTYVHTLPGAQRANAEAVAALVAESATNPATSSVRDADREVS